MHLSALSIYPVKSLRAISLEEARLDELGLENDRRFLIVDEAGKAITQRSDPTLAVIATDLQDGQLVLSGPGLRSLSVPLAPDPSAALRSVEVWRASGMHAEDCGAEATRWFTAFLGRRAHLVRIGAAFSRPIPARKVPATLPFHEPAPLAAPAVHASLGVDTATQHRVSFADAVPLLVLAQASLADPQRRQRNPAHGPFSPQSCPGRRTSLRGRQPWALPHRGNCPACGGRLLALHHDHDRPAHG